MNILYWTDGFWPNIGGVETQSLQFIEFMQMRGHHFEVIAHKECAERKDAEIYNNIAIKRFAFDTIFANNQLQKIREIHNYLLTVRKEFQPELIHLNMMITGGVFAFLLLKKVLCIPTILTIHGLTHRPISPQVLSSVNQIACVSKWALMEMEKNFPSIKNNLKLIYNGISVPNINPTSLNFTNPVILLLGRLSAEKRFDIGIEAFAMLKNAGSDAKLMIVGDGPDRLFLENCVIKLKIAHHVEFVGKCAQSDVSHFINKATIVMIPSETEAFGLVAVEAMQMQRPVIASDVGGLREIIVDQKTGILVPPQNPVALYYAIKKLLENPECAIKMGIEGRKRAEKNFTLDQHALQYENAYKELVEKNEHIVLG